MGGVAKAVGDFVSDAFDTVTHVIDSTVHEITELVGEVSQFVGKVAEGVVKNAVGVIHGAVTGDWVEFRNSAMGIVTTAIAISAIMVGIGVSTVNPLLGGLIIASGVTVLDAQHNDGRLLSYTIDVAANIEEITLHTHYIETYAQEIQLLITTVAAIGASRYGSPQLFAWAGDISGISEVTLKWSQQIDMIKYYSSLGYGAYQIYSIVETIKASQEYWKAMLAEAEAYYRDLLSKAQAAKEQWFDLMTNSDMINRIQAGGDLFMAGAGSDLFSITSVAEPKYALGLIDRSDPDMDRLINNRLYYDFAGNDAFKIK